MFDPTRLDEICNEDEVIQRKLAKYVTSPTGEAKTSIQARLRKLFEQTLLAEILDHYDSVEELIVEALIARQAHKGD
jgi:hypothetical protein